MTPVATVESVPLQTEVIAQGEWGYDPNEPRYCLCNQVWHWVFDLSLACLPYGIHTVNQIQ